MENLKGLDIAIYDAVFQIIAASLFDEKLNIEMTEAEDFCHLHEELKKQTILGLSTKVLSQMRTMPGELYMKWRSETVAQISLFCNYMQKQDDILQAFQKSDIRCAVLKGAVSASYYPIPAYRQMGDVDLLVHSSVQEEAKELLLNLGFEEAGYGDEIERRFHKDGFAVEIHIGFDSQKESGKISEMDEFLFEGMKQMQYRQIMEYTFPSLPEEQNGIVLLEHMHRHLRDGLGLRQVIDWMMYADKILDDTFWTEHMQALFEKFGLRKFAVIITAMCQQYLGLDKEKITWCADADPEICRELMLHILHMGNFGNKLEENTRSLAKLLRYRSPLWLCRNLQRMGLQNWGACQRFPVLKPFAWVYQIGRFIRSAASGKYNMSLSLVLKDRKRTEKASDLLRKLGL